MRGTESNQNGRSVRDGQHPRLETPAQVPIDPAPPSDGGRRHHRRFAQAVLSKGNTKPEMTRKLQEYFEAGVRSVWVVDPRKRTVRLYTSVDQSVLLAQDQLLDGGTVLPGFVLPVRELFVKDER